MVIFLEIPAKIMNFQVFTWKSRKSLNRTLGWVSRKAVKVLRLIRFLGGYLRPGVEFSRITPFLWKWAEFHHISWKCGDLAPFSAPWGGNGARAAPGWKHQRNLSFSYAFLGVPGTEKCVSGWIFTKTRFRVLFLWNSPKWVEFRGIPSFSLNFRVSGVPGGPGPQKGMEFTCITKGFARSAGDRDKCWFYVTYHEIT